MNKNQHYASLITSAIAEMLEDTNGIDSENATEFFTGFILSFAAIYENLTGDKNKDLIDIVALINRLVFQYVKGAK